MKKSTLGAILIAFPFILLVITLVMFVIAQMATAPIPSSAGVSSIAQVARTLLGFLGLISVIGIFVCVPLGIYLMSRDKNESGFSIRESLNRGWEGYKKNFGSMLGGLVIIFVASILPSFISIAGINGAAYSVLYIIINFAIFFLSIGYILMSLSVSRGQKAEFRQIISGLPFFWKYFLVQIVYGLIVLFGFLLFVIPGIYWSIKYLFAEYYVIDKKMGVFESLRASANSTKGVKAKLFGFMIVAQLLSFLGLIAFFVGLFVVVPIISIATAHIYILLDSRAKKIG